MSKQRHFSAIKKDLQETIDHKHFGPMMDSFVSFASDKLGIKSFPTVKYGSPEGSFGCYNPSTNEISVATKNRHPLDIFRTVAHELCHHSQNLAGRIKDVAQEGSTGSDIENEANAEAGKIMRWFAKSNPQFFDHEYVTESTLEEGLYDPARHTAVFLAGGPGSGKDFILKKSLNGHGLTEINSDVALEHLTGKAKPGTNEKERLALAGRKGVIINGTADDHHKIKNIKQGLETQGYRTMMVFVNADNKVSRQRNDERALRGGRKIPEKIRKEKWELSQINKPKYKKMFGPENFIHIDNNHDTRNITPEVKAQIDQEHLGIFKQVRKFTTAPIDNPAAKDWEKKEAGKLQYKQPRSFRSFNLTTPMHLGPRMVNEEFEQLNETGGAGDWGTTKLDNNYRRNTPGQKQRAYIKRKVKVKEDIGNIIGNDGIGPYARVSPWGLGGMPVYEDVIAWSKNPSTIERFQKKYGNDLWEEKLQEVSGKLMNSLNNNKDKNFKG